MPSPYIIAGFGYYVPERVVTNAEMETLVETSDEWITTRTGIKERRFAAPGQATSDLALEAAKAALADAGINAGELTHIVLATLTPDCYCPNAAVIVSEKLGVSEKVCLDVNAACSGFLYALEVTRGLLALHPDAVVLTVAVEVLTSRTNFDDRTTCVLFGDGAGAVVMRNQKNIAAKASIRDIALSSNGALWNLLTVKGGGSAFPLRRGEQAGDEFFIQMAGREVYKHAVRYMETICRDLLAKNNLTPDDINLFIPHQANLRIIEGLGKRLEISMDKVFVNVQKYGNTSAASIPIALTEAYQSGAIRPGHRVLLTSFGGGFTWGAVLLEF
ncbi:MAG: ketoacyl-ACP synthase III [Desulfovibrionaceae bacterium]|nr:ketoacyl-ACP synthase III [Desulfovibrionaceae bacterium]MBF0513250.1 ketoacyl-ACP synthase III [Desulfovibrionaceae bacterium]